MFGSYFGATYFGGNAQVYGGYVTITDSGAGEESISIRVILAVTDTGEGTDLAYQGSKFITDDGTSIEVISVNKQLKSPLQASVQKQPDLVIFKVTTPDGLESFTIVTD